MSMQDSVTVSGGMRSVEDTMDHTNLRHTYDIWLAVAAGQAEDFAESARTAHELRYAQHELRHARQALREAERDLRGAGADQETACRVFESGQTDFPRTVKDLTGIDKQGRLETAVYFPSILGSHCDRIFIVETIPAKAA